MYKRDLITTEIEKLAQVLARIVGLKKDLRFNEAKELWEATLAESFLLDQTALLNPEDAAFLEWLEKVNLGPEKLNVLSDFLYAELDFDNDLLRSQLIARKLNLIYTHLIDAHQIVHMINLGRQKFIQQYF